MIKITPYELAERWIRDHGCTRHIGRFEIKYTEVEKDVYFVTCKHCGKSITVRNK